MQLTLAEAEYILGVDKRTPFPCPDGLDPRSYFHEQDILCRDPRFSRESWRSMVDFSRGFIYATNK